MWLFLRAGISPEDVEDQAAWIAARRIVDERAADALDRAYRETKEEGDDGVCAGAILQEGSAATR